MFYTAKIRFIVKRKQKNPRFFFAVPKIMLILAIAKQFTGVTCTAELRLMLTKHAGFFYAYTLIILLMSVK